MGVSNNSDDPLRVRKLIEQAKQALSSRVFLGKGRTLYYESIEYQVRPAQIEILNIRIDKVKVAVGDCNGEVLNHEISGLYKKDLAGMMHYNYLQHINTVLLGLLTASCSLKGIPYREVFGTDIISVDAVEQLETVNEMCEWYLARFNCLLKSIQKLEDEISSPRFKRVINYINENYCSDISLDVIAEKFGIHKVYLARSFKNETGQTVNEYIRELRIRDAKKLLCRNDIAISEIPSLIGFNNPQTFYNMFKQSTGMSPGKYREFHSCPRQC